MKTNHPNMYFVTPSEAETAYYSAFEMQDIQLMNAVLADEGGVCIHPGALPLIGREQILDSWNTIFSNTESPALHIELLNRTEFDDMAVHLVAERIAIDYQPDAETVLVVATNVYIQQENGWRLLEHHASVPSVKREEINTHSAPGTLQ